ncbi:DNRLRE domain-containing protein [Sorangium sp. So ce233]|uniref:DNRLRE domain-containing protein n=1 Tax=Sorangium sp. So ce233 TaxID=3133290 RepID=UPI003F617558
MRTLTVAQWVCAVLLSAACAQPTEIDPHEEGGEDRSALVGTAVRADNTHTAVVSLHQERARCSGTIVRRSAEGDKVHVLTAAHCCPESSPPREVRVGFDFNDPSLVLPVDSFQSHPCYDDRRLSLNKEYDICVVTAGGAGALNVRPIPLASAPDGLSVGSAVTLVGYGNTPALNTIRRRVEAGISEIGPLMIMTDQTEERGGLCSGDSGGPALIPQGGVEVVAGVISFAPGDELCDISGGIGRVAFPGIRDEFLDKVLAGEKPTVEARLIQRRGITPGPVRDTTIASDQPDQRFGERVDLLVGTPPGTSAVRRALLRFDLAAVPRGATLLTARVGLRLVSKSGPGTISVHRVVKDWDESASWASFEENGFDPTPVATSGTATASVEALGVISFDVTELVASWLGGETDDHGILLRADDGQQSRLLASEVQPVYASSRPWMHLCYLPAPP